MVRAAPIAFISAIAVVGVAIWAVVNWGYSTRLASRDAEIANRNAEVALVTRQRDDYREKLGGATPDQAKAKIEQLERLVHTVVGSRWEPLTSQEIEQLAKRLSDIPPKFLGIFYENQLGKELALSLLDAFKRAQWPDVYASASLSSTPGIAVGYGSGIALKIKGAIESSTKLRLTLLQPNEPDNTSSLYVVAIGIRHD